MVLAFQLDRKTGRIGSWILKMCIHGMGRMRIFEMSVAKVKLESGGHWTRQVFLPSHVNSGCRRETYRLWQSNILLDVKVEVIRSKQYIAITLQSYKKDCCKYNHWVHTNCATYAESIVIRHGHPWLQFHEAAAMIARRALGTNSRPLEEAARHDFQQAEKIARAFSGFIPVWATAWHVC